MSPGARTKKEDAVEEAEFEASVVLGRAEEDGAWLGPPLLLLLLDEDDPEIEFSKTRSVKLESRALGGGEEFG